MDRDTEMEDVSDRRRNDSRERKPSDHERDRRRSRSRDRDHRRRSPSRSPHRSHRHRSRSRSYDRHRDREGRDRDRHRSHRERSRSRSPGHRSGRDRDRDRDYKRSPVPQSAGGPMNAPIEEAEAHAKVSVKENRVYCGNLTYNTTYKDLIEYMKEAGEVAFAEIFVTPAGQSKGCGIVEFADRAGVDNAMKTLGETRLLGRPVFIREDRESEARFGATPVPGKVGAAFGEAPRFAPRPFAGGFGGPPAGAPPDFRQLFVGNLPYTATWQDMKDLFREAGAIIRADVAFFPDGRPKGTGIVVYENHEDAKNAITMYNGYTWQESVLQVRPDRFVGAAGFRGGRGGFAPRGAFGGRGAFPGARGGFGPGNPAGRGGRNFTTDLYADYNGPETYANGTGAPSATPFGGAIEPSKQIMVRNLPWSTSNEDLVELFETTGQVVLAEILYDGTRSKGAGVIQFKEIDEGQQACQKFTGYVYGGRPLDVQFNDRWHRFADSAASGTGGAAV